MAAAATAVIKTTWFKYLTKKRAARATKAAWKQLADWFERRAADKAAAVEAAAAAAAAAAQEDAAATVATSIAGRHPLWDDFTRSQKRNWRKYHRE